jgi:hypothetical protein
MTQPLTHPQTNWASPITTTTLGDTTVTINGSEASSEAGQITLTIDRTPDDAFETAELKLQGICPACRCTDGEHGIVRILITQLLGISITVQYMHTLALLHSQLHQQIVLH